MSKALVSLERLLNVEEQRLADARDALAAALAQASSTRAADESVV